MRTTVIRTGLVASAVGALVLGAVAVGGPASASGHGSSQGGGSAKDVVVIGCAVAGEVSADVVLPPDAVALPAPKGGKDVTGIVRVAEGVGRGGPAKPLPKGSEVVVATGGSGSTAPVPAVNVGPVTSFEVSVDQLPDCSAAK